MHAECADDGGRDDFPTRLSRAIEVRGLSLERLSARLAERGVECSSSTLSLWRRGLTRPRRVESHHAVQVLEGIPGTPPGHLAEAPHTLTAGSREWWQHAARPEDVLHEGARLERMRATSGMQETTGLQRLAMIDIATIDARRRFCGSRCQTVVQAARDGAERIVVSTYRVFHGRAVRTDLDGAQERIRAREEDLLPGATGMQCVSRDVQAAEVAVEWRPGPPAA